MCACMGLAKRTRENTIPATWNSGRSERSSGPLKRGTRLFTSTTINPGSPLKTRLSFRECAGLLLCRLNEVADVVSTWKARLAGEQRDRKSTRLNSSHGYISYAVFCLKKK